MLDQFQVPLVFDMIGQYLSIIRKKCLRIHEERVIGVYEFVAENV